MTDDAQDPVRTRLYVHVPLQGGEAIEIDPGQLHYLKHVLRLCVGSVLSLFNGVDGEWRASISALGKSSGRLIVERRQREQTPEPDIWLIFAPVKRVRIDYIAEKATELGVSALMPVQTRRTIVSRVNQDRLIANAREAAEQTERLSVPQVHSLQSLKALLAGYPADRKLIFCDETGTAPPLTTVVQALGPQTGGWAVMIGPEGGFAEDELDQIRKLPFAAPVSLGPRVLRADTAALAAVAVLQAIVGDWDCPRAGVG